MDGLTLDEEDVLTATAPARTPMEREILAPVELCLPNGRLNPLAVGWSRHPWHDTDRLGRGVYGWGRNKRWEYWAITTPTHIVGLTVSALDYAALHQVWVLDRATRREVDAVAIAPLGMSVTLPGTLHRGPVRARTRSLSIDVDDHVSGTRIRAATPRVRLDVLVDRPAGHEALGVVVPWTSRLFQYTVKDVARPASGTLWVDGEEFPLAARECWAVLDHGRGRWPYSMHWNWGAASGRVGEHVIGLQLGGKWTVGTGSTENALVVDGRIHKISEELDWRYDRSDWHVPWRIRGERVEVDFTPFFTREARTQLAIVASETHQCFGHYTGWVADDTGRQVRVDGLLGWAEDVRNRW
ncbi:DUF2804 domain-containing protein [Archangium violaceum]|uniref:DUF2804 domain-containing protein n=1 Tax=Archangium violaceum TaxID=83451 RepID=UPI00194F2F28|nr:DUF2804 domain-containing protein [Archangium violaceum]QRO00793.1 DUF2804 domain-containing protein [Archangium violaceum]